MEIIKTVEEYKKIYEQIKSKKIGFVPTMGGLHQGHLSLIKKSKEENEITVVSVYLNPTQFNDKKDLETYPANFADDCALLEKNNIDFLFAPTYNEIYPDDYKFKVTENDFSKILCGEKRPGHFDGVLTVVMKLFNIVRPQNAYFGEKDFQQLKLLQNMVRAFFMNINIIACPIVREENGLAISSRNRKLSEKALEIAPRLHQVLIENISLEEKKQKLINWGFEIDYLTQVENRLFVAAFLEGVRLIDNV